MKEISAIKNCEMAMGGGGGGGQKIASNLTTAGLNSSFVFIMTVIVICNEKYCGRFF